MSINSRLEVDWSKTFHISVRKTQFWLILSCFWATRGPIFVKNQSGLALTPVSFSARLEVD